MPPQQHCSLPAEARLGWHLCERPQLARFPARSAPGPRVEKILHGGFGGEVGIDHVERVFSRIGVRWQRPADALKVRRKLVGWTKEGDAAAG
eukprot:scaffold32044_cov30-Tisochrysis_lutea.AAC.9